MRLNNYENMVISLFYSFLILSFLLNCKILTLVLSRYTDSPLLDPREGSGGGGVVPPAYRPMLHTRAFDPANNSSAAFNSSYQNGYFDAASAGISCHPSGSTSLPYLDPGISHHQYAILQHPTVISEPVYESIKSNATPAGLSADHQNFGVIFQNGGNQLTVRNTSQSEYETVVGSTSEPNSISLNGPATMSLVASNVLTVQPVYSSSAHQHQLQTGSVTTADYQTGFADMSYEQQQHILPNDEPKKSLVSNNPPEGAVIGSSDSIEDILRKLSPSKQQTANKTNNEVSTNDNLDYNGDKVKDDSYLDKFDSPNISKELEKVFFQLDGGETEI